MTAQTLSKASCTHAIALDDKAQNLYDALEEHLIAGDSAAWAIASKHFDAHEIEFDSGDTQGKPYTLAVLMPIHSTMPDPAFGHLTSLSSATDNVYVWLPQIDQSDDEATALALDVVEAHLRGFRVNEGFHVDTLRIPSYATGGKALTIHTLLSVVAEG